MLWLVVCMLSLLGVKGAIVVVVMPVGGPSYFVFTSPTGLIVFVVGRD